MECYFCAYWTTQPKEQQKCTNGTTCGSSSDCYTEYVRFRNGTEGFARGCVKAVVCRDTEKACNLVRTYLDDVISCAFECCATDNCNNYTPSSATGVMVTKFTLSLMVIVGFIFA